MTTSFTMSLENIAIKIENLDFSFDKVPILKKVNIVIKEQEFATIVGPNGGGKTTILKLLLGLLIPDNGKIEIFGKSPIKNRKLIGYMPQHLFFDTQFPVSVKDVVLMGKTNGFFSSSNKKNKNLAINVLHEVDLEDKKDELFSKLSGGQKQRALIARALITEPKILLLDEPTSNLDYILEGKFYNLLKRLNKKMTILIVSHDIGFVSQFVNRVLCVNKEIVEHPASEIKTKFLKDMYGENMRLVRHDIKHKGEDMCKNL